MDPNNNALPTGTPAEAGGNPEHVDAEGAAHDETGAGGEGNEQEQPAKKEKTAEQREIERLRRRVDNLTRQKYELRAAVPAAAPQQQQQAAQGEDDEPVTLTRAELSRHIAEQARQLAPTMTEQQAEVERRQGVVTALAREWGQDKFDTIAAELDEAFDGLADHRGTPKPATDAIFQADDPKAIIEYLTDPDNADEASKLSRMSPLQAGRAIGRLEDKLAAAKAKAAPKPSNAAQPLEPARNGGVPTGMPDPSNTKAYIAWANAQERAQR